MRVPGNSLRATSRMADNQHITCLAKLVITKTCTKAAVIHFAKGFSNDLLNRKIRVNVISPGTTDTPVFDRFVPVEQLEAVKQYWAGVMPVGRIGQPSDIGKTAVFPASDDSSFMLSAGEDHRRCDQCLRRAP